jgi:hypothetical protein
MMEDRFSDLLEIAVKSISEKLLEDKYPFGKKNTFIKDPVLDHLFFHIFSDILVSETAYSEMVSEFIKSETEVQNAFDAKLRSRVYDALFKVHDGVR